MSKAAFFFALYDQDKDGELTNIDLHTMSTELFLLMNLLDANFDKWGVISNFITLSAEQSNEQDAVDKLHQILKENLPLQPQQQQQEAIRLNISLDPKYFVNYANTIHNALMDPNAPCIRITLPSLRMIILTEDRLDQFIQTCIPQSFKLQKAFVERQKGLGHEIFEALFIEGKKLANNMINSPNLQVASSSAASPLVSSTSRRSLSPTIPSRPPSRITPTSSTKTSKSNVRSDDEYELV